jgi:hypothetical protein
MGWCLGRPSPSLLYTCTPNPNINIVGNLALPTWYQAAFDPKPHGASVTVVSHQPLSPVLLPSFPFPSTSRPTSSTNIAPRLVGTAATLVSSTCRLRHRATSDRLDPTPPALFPKLLLQVTPVPKPWQPSPPQRTPLCLPSRLPTSIQ